MEKNLYITNYCCNEHSLPVPWYLVISVSLYLPVSIYTVEWNEAM